MEDNKIIITYENPDLDGVACAYAYEEFLNLNTNKATFILFGIYQDEVSFIFNKFEIPRPNTNTNNVGDSKIIIVDASDLRGLSKTILPNNIIEVIDHRKYFNKSDFPNAKFEIELVGAAATIIAEKFYKDKVEISKNSAILLFYAIVSNTINFKANVTTDRDIFISNWLKYKLGETTNYIKEVFEYKTSKLKVSKETFLEGYSAFFKIGGKHIGIIQLEILNAHDFITKNKDDCVLIMSEIKHELKLDLIFITHIDLFDGYNLFLTIDKETEQLLSGIFNLKFTKNVLRREGIIMRKEIVPLIKAHFGEELI